MPPTEFLVNTVEEGKDEAELIGAALLVAAKNVLERKRLAWAEELIKKNELVKTAIEEKSTLPEHYWQAEHRAYETYDTARRVCHEIELELKAKTKEQMKWNLNIT